MMAIELGKFFRNLYAHELLFCEGAAGFMMVVIFVSVTLVVFLMMNLLVTLFSHENIYDKINISNSIHFIISICRQQVGAFVLVKIQPTFCLIKS